VKIQILECFLSIASTHHSCELGIVGDLLHQRNALFQNEYHDDRDDGANYVCLYLTTYLDERSFLILLEVVLVHLVTINKFKTINIECPVFLLITKNISY